MWLEFRRVLFRSLLTAGALILAVNLNVLLAPAKLAPGGVRSEERRVGKECRIGCRSRWSPDQSKKNKPRSAAQESAPRLGRAKMTPLRPRVFHRGPPVFHRPLELFFFQAEDGIRDF